MLSTATPTLQIKVNGISLSQIKTMEIAIRSTEFTILKGNSDIEVDNDIISTFLTKEESEKISNENCNISIMAYNLDDEDVSDRLKVIWAKRGSMSKAGGNGSDADLSNYYTRQEVDDLINESFVLNMGGAKIAQDSGGNWGYIPPGADTVTPFSPGGEGNGRDIKFADFFGDGYIFIPSATTLPDDALTNTLIITRNGRGVLFNYISIQE